MVNGIKELESMKTCNYLDMEDGHNIEHKM